MVEAMTSTDCIPIQNPGGTWSCSVCGWGQEPAPFRKRCNGKAGQTADTQPALHAERDAYKQRVLEVALTAYTGVEGQRTPDEMRAMAEKWRLGCREPTPVEIPAYASRLLDRSKTLPGCDGPRPCGGCGGKRGPLKVDREGPGPGPVR
jgi:hypothetical protein